MSNMKESSRLITVLTEGKGPSLGVWQMLPGANISRILARSGVDWVLVDCEHGNIDDAAMHEAVPTIAAVGVSPIVRLPDMHAWMVKRALDCGAHGILVPLIRTVEEVKSVVAAAKFPPVGKRGFGSPFAMERFKSSPTMDEYLQQANDSLVTMVQIETKEALAAVDEIAAVPGLDLLFCGPFDLANSIGHPIINGVIKPEVREAMAKIRDASKKAGKKCGMFCSNGESAREYAEQGWDLINVTADAMVLSQSLEVQLAAAQGGKKQ